MDEALSRALTGQKAQVPLDPRWIRKVRDEACRLGRPWPFEVPASLLTEIGYATWLAALRDTITELGLDRAPDIRSPLAPDATPPARSGDEQRLLRERPPHW